MKKGGRGAERVGRGVERVGRGVARVGRGVEGRIERGAEVCSGRVEGQRGRVEAP